ncbi:HD domain-containing protein [Thomasclavelia sp.]|uniref:deoxyguanosinetriphosphate triphosphohydrolase family protein n=1 Tax=Thomasclavelia sp. TaxID=3025757 RepID=UPI0025E940F6|nr:HD domain-containing protein [Thomasclavelia sp.]
MTKNLFINEAMDERNPNYLVAIKRQEPIYQRSNDLRTEFGRDYTRIIFSQAYRRLKHKTQVFFAVKDDHVCTRSEHVNLVESISYTIARYLGLNTELTKAIAVGHDLGHAPFGHGGEAIINEIAKKYGLKSFWHERNSLHFIDDIETLEDDEHFRHNLNLTYAIRDGIISHCGEMNQMKIKRREEIIDLNDYQTPGQYAPYTWEGGVVKMADKIAYLARDIEDALRLKILKENKAEVLRASLNSFDPANQFNAINNGTIVNYFIQDVCNNSNPQDGIALSKNAFEIMKTIMRFNYQNIYKINRVKIHSDYVGLMLNSIFDFYYQYGLLSKDQNTNLIKELNKDREQFPNAINGYVHWLEKYSNMVAFNRNELYQNKVIYDFINDDKALIKSIIDYLSGMSDAYIIQIFNELIAF